MKYCVPEDRPWMCTNFKPRECQKLNENWEYFPDGICRDKNYIQPSQIVCPIGKVLCADLSCSDNHYLCPNSTETPSENIRCVNQEVTQYAYECTSTVTCPDRDQAFCTVGYCVDNEVFCQPLKKCPDTYPYRCNNNACVVKAEDCIGDVACGDGSSLCYDGICKERCDS